MTERSCWDPCQTSASRCAVHPCRRLCVPAQREHFHRQHCSQCGDHGCCCPLLRAPCSACCVSLVGTLMHISEEGCALEWLALEGSCSNPMLYCMPHGFDLNLDGSAISRMSCLLRRATCLRVSKSRDPAAPGTGSFKCLLQSLVLRCQPPSWFLPACERQVSLGFFCCFSVAMRSSYCQVAAAGRCNVEVSLR